MMQSAGDVVLTRLRDCTIRLQALPRPFPPNLTNCSRMHQGPTTAIRMFDLIRCTVIAAPVVGGSIFIEACDTCTIVAAAQQIRIHKSQACDFYICARGAGHAIIEHSSGLRFAGCGAHGLELRSMIYCVSWCRYELRSAGVNGGCDVDVWLKDARLELGSNAWAGIEDFNWLKKVVVAVVHVAPAVVVPC